MSFSPQLLARFEEARRQYPPEMAPSLVLPLLHLVQDEHGWVSEADAVAVADWIGIPRVQAIEALTWYSMFDREPHGRYVIKVCRNVACSLRGSEGIVEHLSRKLGIPVGGTTPDGKFTLRTVECLASCGTAPAMQVNRTYHEKLDPGRVDAILEALP